MSHNKITSNDDPVRMRQAIQRMGTQAANGVVPSDITLADAKIIVGNASGVGAAVTASGDVTNDNAGVQTIGNDKVTNAKAANMADSTIKGRAAGAGTGDPTDLTGVQAGAIIKLDDLATPEDNTDLNATTSAHGLLKKLSNTATEFMDGTGAWDTIKDTDVVLADETTQNSTTSRHGLLKKLSSTATEFMNGAGNWATPAGGSWTYSSKSANFTVGASDGYKFFDIDTSGGNITVALTAAATLGANFVFGCRGTSALGTVIIDPNGAETIDGAATYTMLRGNDTVLVICTGSAFETFCRQHDAAQRASAYSVLHNGAASTGPVSSTASATADQVFRMNTAGNSLGFGQVATGGIVDASVTAAKMVNAGVLTGEVTGTFPACVLDKTAITNRSAITDQDGADTLLIYDNSATALKKETRTNFLVGVPLLYSSVGAFDKTAAAADNGTIFDFNTTAATRTLTLPSAATVGAGYTVGAYKGTSAANQVTILRNGTDKISGTAVNHFLKALNAYIIFLSNGSDGWIVIGVNDSVRGVDQSNANVALSATYETVASVVVPPGEWDLTANLQFISNTGNVTTVLQGISADSTATTFSDASNGENFVYPHLPTTAHNSENVCTWLRQVVTASGGTTYIQKIRATFINTCSRSGVLVARRVG
jgi:hypothetical protein